MDVPDELLAAIQANLEIAEAGVTKIAETAGLLAQALEALEALIGSVGTDEASGLVSRRTIHLADEGRLLLSRLAAPPEG